MNHDEIIARKIINESINLKEDEKIIVLTDEKRYKLANGFFQFCSKKFESILISIPEMKYDGAKLSDLVTNQIKNCDVLIAFTTMSVSHTSAVKAARDEGVRVISLPGITQDIYYRAIDVDFKEIVEYTSKLKDTFVNKSKVRVITELGTDVTFSIKDRPIFEMNCICHNPGDFINLPDGEMMLAPIEESMNGIIKFDLSMMPDQMTEYGIIAKLVDEIIVLEVENGKIMKYSGGKSSEILKRVIEDAGDNADIIAEFAIGTNPKAKIIGNILEDEKVKGTCHFAFGANRTFGGKNEANIHLDGIIDSPTIYLDDKKIMEKGLLIE